MPGYDDEGKWKFHSSQSSPTALRGSPPCGPGGGPRLTKTGEIEQMTSDEKIEFLEGQVHALSVVFVAMIYDHPNAARLDRWLAASEQATLERIETTPVAEEYLEGFQDTIEKMKKTLATVKARQEPT
jgi:hypothetical protein